LKEYWNIERILGRDSGEVQMRLQTSKKYNGPNVCSKTILENLYAYDIDLHFLFIDLQKLLTA
jgi:hypothetical protein